MPVAPWAAVMDTALSELQATSDAHTSQTHSYTDAAEVQKSHQPQALLLWHQPELNSSNAHYSERKMQIWHCFEFLRILQNVYRSLQMHRHNLVLQGCFSSPDHASLDY